MTTKNTQTSAARELMQERISSIVFDGEFYQAEPLSYPFNAECFNTHQEAVEWLDRQAKEMETAQ